MCVCVCVCNLRFLHIFLIVDDSYIVTPDQVSKFITAIYPTLDLSLLSSSRSSITHRRVNGDNDKIYNISSYLKFVSREKECNDAIQLLTNQLEATHSLCTGSSDNKKLVRFLTVVGTAGKG